MARTHRSSSASEHAPKYFSKSGFPQDPNKVKRNGAGAYNWGSAMEDLDDLQGEFTFLHKHRRSNSTSMQHPGVEIYEHSADSDYE